MRPFRNNIENMSPGQNKIAVLETEELPEEKRVFSAPNPPNPWKNAENTPPKARKKKKKEGNSQKGEAAGKIAKKKNLKKRQVPISYVLCVSPFLFLFLIVGRCAIGP